VHLQISNIHTYNKTTNDKHPVQRVYIVTQHTNLEVILH